MRLTLFTWRVAPPASSRHSSYVSVVPYIRDTHFGDMRRRKPNRKLAATHDSLLTEFSPTYPAPHEISPDLCAFTSDEPRKNRL